MSMPPIFQFLACLLLRFGCWGNERPVVNSPLGKISGHYRSSYDGRKFSAFEGIPYAKPPTGELRFKEPQKIEPWDGVWQADKLFTCIHYNGLKDIITGTEDCLYLNVYVPRSNPSEADSLDVIVNLHAGCYMVGSGHEYARPTHLMDRDVILVTLNNRLAGLGFLCTDEGDFSCNNGLKDQSMALRWVHENIKSFGGNPSSVTLTGFSAGGSSVHYHYVSPLSKGLFHRGYSFSGTILNPWAYQDAPSEKFHKLSNLLGCDAKKKKHSFKTTVECMRNRSAFSIVETYKQFEGFGNVFPIVPFGPHVEKGRKGAFLPDHPFKLLEEGRINDVPWINSLASQESLFFTIGIIPYLRVIDKQWNHVMPHVLDYNFTVTEEDKLVVAKKARDLYMGHDLLSDKTFLRFSEMVSDRLFNVDSVRASKMQAKVARAHVYDIYFSYKGQHSVTQDLYPDYQEILGVTHGDDVRYAFVGFYDNILSKSDAQMKDLYLDLLSSFAKTGSPKIAGVKWDPVSPYDDDEFTFLHIQSPRKVNLEKRGNLAPTKFWDSLPFKENENLVH